MRTTAESVIFGALVTFNASVALTPRANADGGVTLWTNRFGGPANGNDTASALVVDNHGNVFVTGLRVGCIFGRWTATVDQLLQRAGERS